MSKLKLTVKERNILRRKLKINNSRIDTSYSYSGYITIREYKYLDELSAFATCKWPWDKNYKDMCHTRYYKEVANGKIHSVWAYIKRGFDIEKI